MIIIAFSNKTSKILPRIFCRGFKHCAPIIINGDKMTMYQFVCRGHIAEIKLSMRDIGILKKHGWEFVYMPIALPHNFDLSGAYSCVCVAKRAIGMRASQIQTPGALYNRIK